MTATRERLGGRVRVSHGLAAAAALATLAVVRSSPLALAVDAGGCLALLAGVALRSRGLVAVAGVALFAAAVSAAAGSAGLGATLVGTFAAVLAADFATFALGLDRDVDPSVATTRVELLHAVGSCAVAVVAGGLGYVLFRAVPRGSALGVVALLLAGVVLAVLLRP